ncbi:Ca2 /calmodulin-dependent protein kinase, EF-Hand protein superfamily [Phaffia rhodozyma]|uniref:Ca2 /calmodulin-dependent protein kinase, EF-Hand protein superfamily n=1 Tax=Phaffia rhodozyma TaxID=264483 RepID=A0A0F7SEF4_PHARH|nr:Ca2 /calmodulin-dependent protein kinase, EF-Hand protein superfamily [Phaffia rhodozyma]
MFPSIALPNRKRVLLTPSPPSSFRSPSPEFKIIIHPSPTPLTSPIKKSTDEVERRLQEDPGYRGCGFLMTPRTDGRGKERLLLTSTNPFFIGRNPTCDYVVPSPVVSGKHMRIYTVRNDKNQPLSCVEDLSMNGIVVNGKRLKSQAIFLSEGDIIEIPQTTKRFVFHLPLNHLDEDDHTQLGLLDSSEASILSYREDRGLHPPNCKTASVPATLKIGHYRVFLDQSLGSGSFGKVRLAVDGRTEAQVACKTVPKSRLLGDRDFERLYNELELGLKLDHPNVIKVFKYHQTESHFHIFLQLVTGGDLFSYIIKHRQLEEAEAKYIMYQILHGVQYLHENGCAHRDLKPENILLQQGEVYPTILICDFGLSTMHPDERAPQSNALAIRAPSIVGTAAYFSPEYIKASAWVNLETSRLRALKKDKTIRARNEVLLDASRLDCWSLGVVLFIIATGYHPFGNEEDEESDCEMQSGKSSIDQHRGHSRRMSSDAHAGVRPGARSFSLGEKWKPAARMEVGEKTAEQHMNLFSKRVCEQEVQFSPDTWSSYHPSVQDLILGLLRREPAIRMSVRQALRHTWFEKDRHSLEESYQTRVVQGRLGRSSRSKRQRMTTDAMDF